MYLQYKMYRYGFLFFQDCYGAFSFFLSSEAFTEVVDLVDCVARRKRKPLLGWHSGLIVANDLNLLLNNLLTPPKGARG